MATHASFWLYSLQIYKAKEQTYSISTVDSKGIQVIKLHLKTTFINEWIKARHRTCIRELNVDPALIEETKKLPGSQQVHVYESDMGSKCIIEVSFYP